MTELGYGPGTEVDSAHGVYEAAAPLRPSAKRCAISADFGESLGALINVVAAIIPWLIEIIPGLWFLIRVVRRLRERRRAAKAAAPAA